MWSVFGGRKAEVAAEVESIFIYPIKSCRGIPVSEAPITSTGFCWDRQWLVINSKGRAYTQRVEPKLALVEVQLPNAAFIEDWEPTNTSYLVLRAPGMNELKVSLKSTGNVIDGVSVWEWTGSALDEGTETSEWFSNYLGKPSCLVRFIEGSETRAVDPEYASGYRTMFSDGYPFMLLSQGSLNALNELLREPLPINRFRPNILLDGCEPYAEDLWTEIKINDLTFYGVKLCRRCKIPTINQENGIAGSEPTETLMKVRSDKVLRPNRKLQGKVYFGQNLVCKESLAKGKSKVVKVGDPVYVLKKLSEQEDLIVWMRTAELPNFRKLYGKIEVDLQANDIIQVTLQNNYNTYSFSGEKKLVLSTTSWLGGKNDFLGVAYLTVGGLCFFLALVFSVVYLIKPRRLGDPSYLSWNSNPAGH